MSTTTVPTRPVEGVSERRPESQGQIILKRFLRHRGAMVSSIVLLLFFGLSLAAPIIAPYPRDDLKVERQFTPPFSTAPETGTYHLLGTDNLGYDLFTRVLYAARVSLTIAILVVIIAEIIGITMGLLAGYYGGWIDNLITRFIEFVSTFPTLQILLIMNAVLLSSPWLLPLPGWYVSGVATVAGVPDKEAFKLAIICTTLAVLSWTGTARLMRAQVLSVRENAYIESSRALGASSFRTITTHILPNSIGPLIVDFTLGINGILVVESILSVLGFGVQTPTPTWGNMLGDAESVMLAHPWMPLIAGIPLVIAALAVNFVGDGLRDALDPRMIIGGKRRKK